MLGIYIWKMETTPSLERGFWPLYVRGIEELMIPRGEGYAVLQEYKD
jgi:hypothetical protein